MNYDRKFVIWGFCFMIAGLCLGIYMAASQNHAQYVTHAHTLLVGFLLSFVYAVIHHLWLTESPGLLARVQFVLHQAGALVIVLGLFLLYGGFMPLSTLDPILAIASLAVLAAALTMFYLLIKAFRQAGG